MASKIYKAPAGEQLWDKADFYIDDMKADLFAARVSAVPFNRFWPGHQRSTDQTEVASFVSFEMDSPVQIRIEYERDYKEIIVRPLSRRIEPVSEGKCVTFEITEPGGYTVEADGHHEAIHVFANPVQNYEVDINDENTLYFAQGVHDIGRCELHSNQTVFIDEGAVVYGGFHATDSTDICIIGRGILDYSRINETILYEASDGDGCNGVPNALRDSTIQMEYCENITVEGIIIRDALFLTLRPIACKNVTIDNVKIIGNWRYNSDGIDIVNCVDVSVKNCFVRSYDDSICLKGFYFLYSGGIFHNEKSYDSVDNCIIENCVVWCDWGQALEIGADVCARSIKNSVFRNCDVIRATCSVLDIQNVDYANIHDITYENIRIEYDIVSQPPRLQAKKDEKYIIDPDSDYLPSLISLHIFNHYEYSGGGVERGYIHNITFRDIYVTGPKMPPSKIEGYNEKHAISDITVSGLYYNGKHVTDMKDMNIEVGNFVTRFVLEP